VSIYVSSHAAHELTAGTLLESSHAYTQDIATSWLWRTHFDYAAELSVANPALALLSMVLPFSSSSRPYHITGPGRPSFTTYKIWKELSICQSSLYQDWVSLPVLSQVKQQAPRLVVPSMPSSRRHDIISQWLLYQARRSFRLYFRSQGSLHLRLCACMSLPHMYEDDTAAREIPQLAA
jgi:hypothetical protein